MSKRRKTGAFSISFTVNNFSEVKGNVLSPIVTENDVKWRISIQPTYKNENGQLKKYLGYYLRCDGIDGGSQASTWSCHATADLRVIAVKQGLVSPNYSKQITSQIFSSKSNSWGHAEYMRWEDVENAWHGLIEDDSVTFLARITADEPQICERCEERSCRVCLKEEVCIVFEPCAHLATCSKCSPKLSECPICRKKIDRKLRVFV